MTRKTFSARPNAWPACCKCGSTSALARHHIYPRSFGGVDEPWNLAWLCTKPAGGCHRTWHELRRARGLRGKGHRHASRVFGAWLHEIPVADRTRSTVTSC